MDIEQELGNLEDGIRRLKIEYEIFFNGGSTRMPYDLRWRVETLIKKHSDNGKMTFAQRFRYNTLAAKFHSYSELWRRMTKTKEEGRPPLTAPILDEANGLDRAKSMADRVICQLNCTDPELETEKLQNLFKSLVEAKRECGERPETVEFQSFKKFLSEKTSKLKSQFHCETVCYIVSIESGRVKFTAKGGV